MIRVFGLTNKSLFDFVFSFLEKLSEIRKHELYNVARLLYIRGTVAATSAVRITLSNFECVYDFMRIQDTNHSLQNSVRTLLCTKTVAPRPRLGPLVHPLQLPGQRAQVR